MVKTELEFQNRLARLGRKHALMSQGYVLRTRADGLAEVHLQRPARRRLSPLKGLIYVIVGFSVFKALMLSVIGDSTYESRIAKLGQGTMIEQGGAWFMQVDPLTGLVVKALAPVAR